MSEADPSGVLLVAEALYPQAGDDAALHAWELARALGVPALSLAASGEPAPAEWRGLRILARQPGEGARQAWLGALEELRPRVVLVHGLGELSPDALFDLREREIRYALYVRDYQQICPTRRLWHRRREICSGPGPGGFKCAWCVSGGRLVEWPARLARYRHYPDRWQVAMAGAEAVIVASRALRDAWIAHGTPPDRLVVATPMLPSASPSAVPPPGARRGRSLVYAGGMDEAEGCELLAEALEAIGEAIAIEAVGALDAAQQAALRAALPAHHPLRCHGALAPAAMASLLAGAGAVALPVRWQRSHARLLELAWRQGAPPVTAALGGFPERMVHGLNGFLAEPDDAGSLVEALGTALRPPAEAAEWDAAAARRQSEAQAAADLETLRRLLALLAADTPHAAARAAFAAPLAAAEAEFSLGEEAAYGHLRSALEGQIESAEPVEMAFARIAAAASRARRVHLNHALACYHAAGTRSVLCVGGGSGDAARWFAAWGIEAASEEPQPRLAALARRLGTPAAPPGFAPDAVFLDRGASADLDALRRRYPRVASVIAATPSGIEIL